MKIIKVCLLTLLMLASSLLFGQAYQVTAMNGYSVNKPKLDVVGDQAMITFATNFNFYSFPLTGPTSPIENPVKPDMNAWGPTNVDIAHANGQVYIVYTDFNQNSEYGQYDVRYVSQTIGSPEWTIPIILDTVSIGHSIMMTYTNQDLQVGANGAYLFWRNQIDDNSIYFSKSYGSLFSQKRKVLGDSLSLIKDYSFTVIPVEGTDHLFLIYAQDSSLFFISSSDEGSTFSEPTKIDSLEGFWSDFYDLQIVGLLNGTIYAKGQFWQFVQHWDETEQPGEDEPPMDMDGTRLYRSTDFGAHWSIVNTLPASNSQIALTPGGTIVLTQYPSDPNLYVKTSTDAISWSDSVRINPNENTATGWSDIGFDVWIIDETTMAVAWIDTTTGYDEIWYRTLTIPTPPLVSVEKSGINTPQEAILVQNYPNPFNPVTKFSYQLPSESFVELSIFDINGRLVDKIVNQFQPAGYYSVQWNAGNYSTGVYLYKFRADNFQQVGKCLLLK
ncbi:MAG TPA: T9SS type A sorting domain-containing protein [Candidatus Marinimicrobia bacterium]|nr:T9SS type A sorting domain-containing protein [Candidatus Neomarinimicrobiota bacterium]